MKGVKTYWKISFALLASAALGFAQGPVQGQQANNYPAASYPAPSYQAGPHQTRPYAADQNRQGQPDTILPGTLNYVEGQVTLDNQPLGPTGTVVLQPGQTLVTGNGFAEVLLTPGAFLRLGHNSQVRLVTSGLADTKAQLDRGTALVEVDQLIKGTNLAVVISGGTAQVEKKGLYDFDADQRAVKVLDGKATVMEGARKKTIGKDDQLLLAGDGPLKSTGFDSKALKAEPLYVWSEARSQNESQANVELAQNVAAYGGWDGPGWYWNPYSSFYSYLPEAGLLYSPFGWGFYSPAFIGYYGVPFGYYGHYGHFGHYGHYGHYYGGFHGRVAE